MAERWRKKPVEIEAVQASLERTRQERDEWMRHAQTSDKEVAQLRAAAGDADYSPAYQDEYQRLWYRAERERDEAVARERELREALPTEEVLTAIEHLADFVYARSSYSPGDVIVREFVDAARAALVVAGRPPTDREQP